MEYEVVPVEYWQYLSCETEAHLIYRKTVKMGFKVKHQSHFISVFKTSGLSHFVLKSSNFDIK